MCPDRKLLEQLTLGLLSHDHFAPLEEHLATCQRCLQTLEEMEPSDTLIEAMRAAHRPAEHLAGLAEESGPVQPAGFALSPGSFHQLSAEAALHTSAQEGEARREQRCPPDVDDTSSSAVGAFSTVTPLPKPRTDPDDGCDECHDFLAPAQSPGELGRLGDYRVLRVLGRGGMGVVFEAEDVRLKRHVALKAMLPDFAFRVSARKRFLREAQAAAAVEHDHIVSIYQVGEERGVPFLAMPLLRGETLADRLASGPYADGEERPQAAGFGRQTNASLTSGDAATTPAPLTVQETLRIGREIALGLAAAHGRGLIHRDIKPSNIWLEEETGRAKILDFGLARSATGSEQLTQSGTTVGTPAYMSPEQAGGQELDERSDLFSLGCVLYHMATGWRPFIGRDFLSTILAVTAAEPPPPRALNPELPGGLNDLIVALLSKEPSSRPQSAREVAERLSSVANDLAQRAGSPLANSGSERTKASVSHPTKPPYLRFVLVCAVTVLVAGIVIVIKDRKGRTVATVRTENRADITHDPAYTAEVKSSTSGDESISKHRTAAPAEKVASIPAPAGRPTPRAFLVRPTAPAAAWPADAPRPAIAPFDEDQAKKHQQAWADYLKLPLERTNSIGMKLVLIPPGEFMMGGTPEELEEALDFFGDEKWWQEHVCSEAPRHKVVLTQPFYLAVHEVTQKEYEAVMGTNPSNFAKTGMDVQKREQVAGIDTANHPVDGVNWNDAARFCTKLSRQEMLQPFYFRDDESGLALNETGYYLPTEAEWEFACRAGTTAKFWIGEKEEELRTAGWLGLNSGGRTRDVEELSGNPFGLFDVHGNLWEWVEDAWQPTFYSQFIEKPAVDPRCPIDAGPERVMRGGNFECAASACRSSSRNGSHPTNRSYGIGFRVALTVNRDLKRRPAAPSAASVPAPTGLLAPPAPQVEPAAPAVTWPSDAPPPAIAPFDEEQAHKHQQAWADYLKLPLEHTNSIGMKLVLIPPGEFLMGGTPEEIEQALSFIGEDEYWQEHIRSEAPRHKVVLTQPFYLAVHEVTQKEYEAVMGTNPSNFAATGADAKKKEQVAGVDTANYPVEAVSWNDAAQFCAELSRKENLKPFYFCAGERVLPLEGTGYRLPSEAEWEFACRAGTTTRFWIGETKEQLRNAGWWGSPSGYVLHQVEELLSNPFGLYDVHGNLWEWVEDAWDPTFYGQFLEKPAVNPRCSFSAGPRRVIRGGYFEYIYSACRSSSRNDSGWGHRSYGIGFRVALKAVK